MANVEVSDDGLTELNAAPASDDAIPIYDKSTGILKYITPENLVIEYNTQLAALASLISAASMVPYFTGSGTAALLSLLNLNFHRSIFTYNGDVAAYTIKAKGASYFCKEKHCYWDSELTTAAISSPVSNTIYYLYLDYSAITSGTEITANELIWSTTAPSWNGTYKGWYNGNDRCIFAIPTNAAPDNIREFFHDGGDYISYAFSYSMLSQDVDTTFVEVDCSTYVPGFSTKIFISSYLDVQTGDAVVTAYWRTKGQSTTSAYHTLVILERIGTDQHASGSTPIVYTDSSQVFEVNMSRDGDDVLTVLLEGWYLPIGM